MAKPKVDVLHYREHRITDWVSRTTAKGMGLVAKAIFMALLDAQWLEGSLADDQEILRRTAQAEREEWAQFVPFLDGCFPVWDDGRRRCIWLHDERESVIKSRAERSKKGREAIAKRWQDEYQTDTNGDTKTIGDLSETGYQTDTRPIPTRVSSHQSPVISQESLVTNQELGGGEKGVGENQPPVTPPQDPSVADTGDPPPPPEWLVLRVRECWDAYPRLKNQDPWPDPGPWLERHCRKLLEIFEPLRDLADGALRDYLDRVLATWETTVPRSGMTPKKALESWASNQRVFINEQLAKAPESKPEIQYEVVQ